MRRNCCNNFCKKRHIEKIIAGPRGLSGPTGPTGPTGPSGENLVVKSTTTLDAGKQARVSAFHDGNTTFLDFFIPRGFDGKPEKVVAGKAKQVAPNEEAKIEDRYENNTHYLDFSIPKGERGEKGPTGPKGEKGDAGAMGPEGKKGEQGVQGIMGPKGETGPQGVKGDVGPTGPRGFPGEIGISERISIDLTETTRPGENAQVLDDFENNVHHLTFYIPQGIQGPKGDKNDDIIEVGTTTQVGENEPAKVVDRHEGNVHYLDFQIPQGKTGATGDRGPQGIQGAQGVAGPPGTTNNINATIYNSINQDAVNGRPLTLDEVLTNNGLNINNSSITITSNGTYILSFSVNNGTTASAGDCVGIYKNGELVLGTRRPLTTSTNVSATVVAVLKRNDIITLVPMVSTNRIITASGAPSALLTVIQIA